jgi:hypothetical protein
MVEIKKDRKVLRPLLGASVQATTFGGGCRLNLLDTAQAVSSKGRGITAI